MAVDAPSLCAWALSADLIVWGTISDLRLVAEPMVEHVTEPSSSWRWRDEPCDHQWTSHAMQVEIQISNVLSGEYVGETIVAHIGSRQRIEMNPRPFLDEEGMVEWHSIENWMSADNPAWSVGDSIGFALRYVPSHEVYSVMGEAPFSNREGGGTWFHQLQYPIEKGPPVGASGLSVDELGVSVAACDPNDDASEARAYRFWALWGPGSDGRGSPYRYFAASCFGPYEDEQIYDDEP